MKDIFSPADSDELIARIESLTPDSAPLWGKMTVDQMFAHLNVVFKQIYKENPRQPNFLMRFALKTFIKPMVLSEKPYRKGIPTFPAFKQRKRKNFEEEKAKLIGYIRKTTQLGPEHFEGRESVAYGKFSSQEWSNMLFKHTDHHLQQFGA